MCDCPEPKRCEDCHTFDDVYDCQGVHLCEKCFVRRVYA